MTPGFDAQHTAALVCALAGCWIAAQALRWRLTALRVYGTLLGPKLRHPGFFRAVYRYVDRAGCSHQGNCWAASIGWGQNHSDGMTRLLVLPGRPQQLREAGSWRSEIAGGSLLTVGLSALHLLSSQSQAAVVALGAAGLAGFMLPLRSDDPGTAAAALPGLGDAQGPFLSTGTPAASRCSERGLLAGAGLLSVVIGVALFTTLETIRPSGWWLNGLSAQAVVVRVTETGIVYHPTVRFTTADGAVVEAQDNIVSIRGAPYQPGDNVNVTYLRSRPTSVLIDWLDTAPLPFLVAAAFLLVGLYPIWRWLDARRWGSQLLPAPDGLQQGERETRDPKVLARRYRYVCAGAALWACNLPVLKLFARLTNPLADTGAMLYFVSLFAILIPLFLHPRRFGWSPSPVVARVEIAVWALLITLWISSIGLLLLSGLA